MKEEFEKEEMIQYEAKSLYLMNNFYKKALLFLLYAVPDGEETNIIKDFAKLRENSYVYTKTSFLSDNEKIPNDGHPNKNGHQTFAKELFESISKNSIIPCN